MGPVALTPIAVYDPNKEGNKLIGVFSSMSNASMFIHNKKEGKAMYSKVSSKNRIPANNLPVEVVIRHANAEQVAKLGNRTYYLEDENYAKYASRIPKGIELKHTVS